MRVWDVNTTADAASKGYLAEFLFEEETKFSQEISSSNKSPYEGVEEFRWIEYQNISGS